MSRLPGFTYSKPSTMEDAYSLLGTHTGNVKLVAGGTDLFIQMQQGLSSPQHVISLNYIPDLNYIADDQQTGLRIGALTTIYDLANSPVIKEKYNILSQAAEQISVPPLRQTGTVGGNICLDTRCIYYNQSQFWRQARGQCIKSNGTTCHAIPGATHCSAVHQGDLVPALVALEAMVKLVSNRGERVIRLIDFFTGKGERPNVLEPDELLSEIDIPPLPEKSSGAYQKLRVREAIDFPLAGVAVRLDTDDEGTCHKVKIVLGSVASAPVEATEAEEVLRGKRLEDNLIAEAEDEAFNKAHPVDNLSISSSYRRQMIKVLLKRAILQIKGGLQ